jgi:hypothetical protein
MRSKELLKGHDPSPPPALARRSLSIWDLVGIIALFSLGAVATGAVGMRFAHADHGYGREMLGLLSIGLIGIAVSLWLGNRAADREGLALRDLPRRLVLPWANPSHDRLMFLFGFLLGVPLLALHTTVILGDADSAKLLASILYVQREGPRYLVQSQENLLPHLILGPVIALGGISGAKMLGVLTLQGLCGVTSYITWKLTRSMIGALAAVPALLSFRSIPERATLLPMYSAMLALGFYGVYLAFEAIRSEGRRRWLYAALSGLSLYLSTEAHALGLVFLAIPMFLFITMPVRRAAQALWRVYLALAIFYLPRAVLNLTDGGLSHFLTYRDDYWVSKGYISLIQKNFWRLPNSSLSIPRYVLELPRQLPTLAGRPGVVALAVALVGFVLARGRLRWFALVCLAFFMAPFVYRRAPYYPRYYSPVAVGASLCAAAAVALLAFRRRGLFKHLAGAAVALLVLAAAFNGFAALRVTRAQQRAVLNGPFQAMAARIDDGKGVIGARSTYLLFASTHVRTFGGQFLSEGDYVTYLTWPSDRQVISMMRRNDIGWVLINPKLRLETTYHNTWLVPTYGKRARQVDAVAASPNFCPVFDEDNYILYKLGSCR